MLVGDSGSTPGVNTMNCELPAWVQIPDSVTISWLLNLFDSQFPYLSNEGGNNAYPQSWCKHQMVIRIKGWEPRVLVVQDWAWASAVPLTSCVHLGKLFKFIKSSSLVFFLSTTLLKHYCDEYTKTVFVRYLAGHLAQHYLNWSQKGKCCTWFCKAGYRGWISFQMH